MREQRTCEPRIVQCGNGAQNLLHTWAKAAYPGGAILLESKGISDYKKHRTMVLKRAKERERENKFLRRKVVHPPGALSWRVRRHPKVQVDRGKLDERQLGEKQFGLFFFSSHFFYFINFYF